MNKRSELDYEKLTDLFKKSAESKLDSKIAVDHVRGRMHKVAFDVYSVDNDPYDGLWRLESNADDGKDYLVRIDSSSQAEAKTGWMASSNDSASSVTLAYKGVPIQRLSAKIFGFSKEDVGLFKKALIEKVACDSLFRDKVLDMQPEEKKAELTKVFPELFIK